MIREFLLVSSVSYGRRPMTCASELTRNVECQSSTVDKKKPTTSPLHPPMRKHATPSDQGPIQLCLSSQRISGYCAKSLIWSTLVSLYLSQRIQPTWLHQKPLRGEWMSRSVSENLWWLRWFDAHHSGPFCAHVRP